MNNTVYGTTIENSIKNIKRKMNKLVEFLEHNSPIPLYNIKWVMDCERVEERIDEFLEGERNFYS